MADSKNGANPHNTGAERARALQKQLSDRAANAADEAIEKLEEAAGAAVLAGSLKVAAPVAEFVKDAGTIAKSFLADLLGTDEEDG